jgi:hypothetical protein
MKRYCLLLFSGILALALMGCGDLLNQKDESEKTYYEALAMALSHMSFDAVNLAFEGALEAASTPPGTWPTSNYSGEFGPYSNPDAEPDDPEENVSGTCSVTAPALASPKFNLNVSNANFDITLTNTPL